MKTVLLTALLFSSCALAQTPQFKVQDLGSLPSLPNCTATALSQSGNVVGYCFPTQDYSLLGLTGSPPVSAFLYTNGAIQNLNLTTFQTPLPTAVNDSGVVTGAYVSIGLTVGLDVNTFVAQNGTSQILQGTLQSLVPFGLNNSGQLIGTRFDVTHAFNFFLGSQALLTSASGASPVDLPPAPGIIGTADTVTFGINPAGGWMAGATVGPNATIVDATLWQTQGQTQAPQLLPALTNYAQSLATAVNDSGMAAGLAFDMNLETLTPGPVPGSDAHAVLYTTGAKPAITDLGVLSGDKSSMALGINNSGWVVGFSDKQAPSLGLNLAPILTYPTSDDRAFLYANGTMYDLNTLIEGGNPGWQFCFAVGVNNAGQITGTGFYQGQQRAFLLTPVAAQAAPNITGVGGAAGSVPPVTTISENGIVSIYGSAFAASSVSHVVTSADLVNGALPTNVENVCVQGGSAKWGLLYVSATQVNALAESLPTSGPVPVSVIANCGTGNDVTSAAMNVTAAAAAPEFLYFVINANGQNPVAAIQNSNGSYVGAPGLISGATFAPAHAGDVLVAFGVGWGGTDSKDPIGTLATGAANVSGSYSLKVGDQDATVLYAGLTPGFAGLYQVDFTVPSFPAGAQATQSLVLTVNGASTPTGGYITIAQ